MEWISVLPNLSVGVVSVGALVYVSTQFLRALSEERKALREVEKEVRQEILQHLTSSTITIKEAVQVMERVVRKLDSK